MKNSYTPIDVLKIQKNSLNILIQNDITSIEELLIRFGTIHELIGLDEALEVARILAERGFIKL